MAQAVTTYSFLQSPQDYLAEGGRKVVYAGKQGLNFIVHLTGSVGTYAKVVRKITEAIGPALAHLYNFTARWAIAARPFEGVVAASDLCEPLNDAQYFLNGGYAKDITKYRKYRDAGKLQDARQHAYSIMGQMALVPANLMGVALFVKDIFNLSYTAVGNFASSIGNVRLFGFAPKLAEAVQAWPVFRSIPDLSGKAAWIGNVRVFGFIGEVGILTVLRTLVNVAQGYFVWSNYLHKNKCEQKAEKYGKELKTHNVTLNPDTKDLKKHFDAAKVSAEDRKIFVKYTNNLWKAKQSRLSMYGTLSEITLRSATMAGFVVGATVAGSVAIGTLGALSLLCVGRSVYYRFSTSKLELQKVL